MQRSNSAPEITITPKTLRIIGIVYCVLAAVFAVLNLKRTVNLGLRFVPLLLLVLGARQFISARRIEARTKQP